MSHTETRSCSARQEVDRHLSPRHRAAASAKPARRGPILGRPRRRCVGSGSGLLPIRAPRSALRMLSAAREATPPSRAGPAGELKPNCAAPASTSSPEKDVKRTWRAKQPFQRAKKRPFGYSPKAAHLQASLEMARPGLEPGTPRFSAIAVPSILLAPGAYIGAAFSVTPSPVP